MIVLTLHPQFINRQNWKLDDTNLKIIEISNTQELKEARDIIQHIQRRELYQFCNEFSVPKDKMEHFKKITPQDIICSQVQKKYDFTMIFVFQKWTNSILKCQSENGWCDARRRRYCCSDRFDPRKKQPSSKHQILQGL